MRRLEFSQFCGLSAAVLVAVLSLSLTSQGQVQGQGSRRVLVLVNFTRPPAAAERALVTGASGQVRFAYSIVPAFAVELPEAALAGLAANPRVSFIEPDAEVTALDTELDAAWGVKLIGAGDAHASDPAVVGTGVNVAVIDTGVDYTHPDLAPNYRGGFDFLNNDADPMDDCGHGTHVAGTIAGADNDQGVVGVAPGVNLYALKFMGPNPTTGTCTGPTSGAIAALDWAFQHNIQVTNNSWGSQGLSLTLQQAFANANARGILNIAAAGNYGACDGAGDNVWYPAAFRSVVAVAAIDSSSVRACFSSTGPKVEIAAPGAGVYSTRPNGQYGLGNGTSMASPHVAGAAALLFSTIVADANGNGSTNDEIRNALASSAVDLGASGRDPLYGYGRVSVPGALSAAGAVPPLTLRVDSIAYTVTGNGKSAKDLTIGFGTTYGLVAATPATVKVQVLRNGANYATGTIVTDAEGNGTLVVKNASSGSYTTRVTSATAATLTWDGKTPANSFVK